MSIGLGNSIELINIPFLVLTCNPIVFKLFIMALEYVEECEAEMKECYDSMSPQEKAFMDDNSMFNLVTNDLTGQRYYV